MKKRLDLIIIFLFLIFELSAQNSARYALDSLDLASFKEEAKYKYLLFFESTLNLIDARLDINDRYRSRSVMLELFSNSTSTISDILSTPRPSSYNPYSYGYELLRGAQEMPLLYKRYKYSDDFDFKRQSYKGLNLGSDNKSYDIYEAEMFVLEKLINSANIPKTLINEPTFNAYEEGLVKLIRFRIGHNENKEYELKINSIDILDPENNNYDYKSLVKSIEKSKYKWSDQSEEEYVNFLQNEAIDKGILPPVVVINQKTESLIKKEINIVFKEDTLKYLPPKLIDYALPGYGHIRYGLNKDTRYLKTAIYGTVFLASTSYAVYNKILSEKAYQVHQDAVTFRSANNFYNKANKYHKHFIVSTGISIATLITNAVHINFSHKNQIRRIEKARKNKNTNIDLSSSTNFKIPKINLDSGISLTWEF